MKTRQGIANVFAKFYEDLYVGEEDEEGGDAMMSDETDQDDYMEEFTTEEIQNAIDRLKKGKAKDSNGIRAEQLKLCSEETKEEIRKIFIEIAQQKDFTPKSWRKIRIQVIHKKRRQRGRRKRQAGMWSTNTIQAVCNGIVRSTCPRVTQSAAT